MNGFKLEEYIYKTKRKIIEEGNDQDRQIYLHAYMSGYLEGILGSILHSIQNNAPDLYTKLLKEYGPQEVNHENI